MAKYKPWLKMWIEWIDDLKMVDLTLAEQAAWWRLVTLAQKCATEGPLVRDNGTPLSLDEITDTLRIKTKADRKTFDSMMQKMAAQGSLHWDSNTLVVTHLAERQARAASDTPEAVRDRVRRYREGKAGVTGNPLHPLTPEALAKEIRATLMALPETIDYLVEHEIIKDTLAKLAQERGLVPKSEVTTDTGRIDLLWKDPTGKVVAGFEIDVYEPKKRSLTKLNSLDCPYAFVILRTNPQPLRWEGDILLIGLSKEKESSKEKDTTVKDIEVEAEAEAESSRYVTRQNSLHLEKSEPALAKIATLHEQFFGIITPNLAEKFKDFVEKYHGPVEWIDLAFAEAVKYKNRRWQYVQAILYSWQEKGGPHDGREQPGRGTGAHREDAGKGDKFSGFRAIESGPDQPDDGDED